MQSIQHNILLHLLFVGLLLPPSTHLLSSQWAWYLRQLHSLVSGKACSWICGMQKPSKWAIPCYLLRVPVLQSSDTNTYSRNVLSFPVGLVMCIQQIHSMQSCIQQIVHRYRAVYNRLCTCR
jgi:hypothetical protein